MEGLGEDARLVCDVERGAISPFNNEPVDRLSLFRLYPRNKIKLENKIGTVGR
jgi:hypothetical protein